MWLRYHFIAFALCFTHNSFINSFSRFFQVNKKVLSAHSTSYVPFNKLIEKSKRTGNWTDTINSAESTLQSGPFTPEVMTGIIRAYGESGDLGKAISMLNVMKNKGIKPNHHHFGAILQSCRITKQWEIGLALFNRMDDFNITKTTFLYNILINVAASSQRADIVSEVLNNMQIDGVEMDSFSYSSAILAYCKCKQVNESLRLWEKLLVSKIKIHNVILNNILHSCIAAGMWRKAVEIFNSALLMNVEYDEITLSNCILAYGELNDLTQAQFYFNMTFNNSFVKRDSGLYNAMLIACERNKRPELIREYISLMTQENIPPDAKTFSIGIRCYSKAGWYIDSLYLLCEMESLGMINK